MADHLPLEQDGHTAGMVARDAGYAPLVVPVAVGLGPEREEQECDEEGET